jgi:hypothetical protein
MWRLEDNRAQKNRTAIHPPPHSGVTKNGFFHFFKTQLAIQEAQKIGAGESRWSHRQNDGAKFKELLRRDYRPQLFILDRR